MSADTVYKFYSYEWKIQNISILSSSLKSEPLLVGNNSEFSICLNLNKNGSLAIEINVESNDDSIIDNCFTLALLDEQGNIIKSEYGSMLEIKSYSETESKEASSPTFRVSGTDKISNGSDISTTSEVTPLDVIGSPICKAKTGGTNEFTFFTRYTDLHHSVGNGDDIFPDVNSLKTDNNENFNKIETNEKNVNLCNREPNERKSGSRVSKEFKSPKYKLSLDVPNSTEIESSLETNVCKTDAHNQSNQSEVTNQNTLYNSNNCQLNSLFSEEFNNGKGIYQQDRINDDVGNIMFKQTRPNYKNEFTFKKCENPETLQQNFVKVTCESDRDENNLKEDNFAVEEDHVAVKKSGNKLSENSDIFDSVTVAKYDECLYTTSIDMNKDKNFHGEKNLKTEETFFKPDKVNDKFTSLANMKCETKGNTTHTPGKITENISNVGENEVQFCFKTNLNSQKDFSKMFAVNLCAYKKQLSETLVFDDIDNCIFENALSVHCNLALAFKSNLNLPLYCGNTNVPAELKCLQNLSRDLETVFLKNISFSDIISQINCNNFEAHKALLYCRCPNIFEKLKGADKELQNKKHCFEDSQKVKLCLRGVHLNPGKKSKKSNQFLLSKFTDPLNPNNSILNGETFGRQNYSDFLKNVILVSEVKQIRSVINGDENTTSRYLFDESTDDDVETHSSFENTGNMLKSTNVASKREVENTPLSQDDDFSDSDECISIVSSESSVKNKKYAISTSQKSIDRSIEKHSIEISGSCHEKEYARSNSDSSYSFQIPNSHKLLNKVSLNYDYSLSKLEQKTENNELQLNSNKTKNISTEVNIFTNDQVSKRDINHMTEKEHSDIQEDNESFTENSESSIENDFTVDSRVSDFSLTFTKDIEERNLEKVKIQKDVKQLEIQDIESSVSKEVSECTKNALVISSGCKNTELEQKTENNELQLDSNKAKNISTEVNIFNNDDLSKLDINHMTEKEHRHVQEDNESFAENIERLIDNDFTMDSEVSDFSLIFSKGIEERNLEKLKIQKDANPLEIQAVETSAYKEISECTENSLVTFSGRKDAGSKTAFKNSYNSEKCHSYAELEHHKILQKTNSSFKSDDICVSESNSSNIFEMNTDEKWDYWEFGHLYMNFSNVLESSKEEFANFKNTGSDSERNYHLSSLTNSDAKENIQEGESELLKESALLLETDNHFARNDEFSSSPLISDDDLHVSTTSHNILNHGSLKLNSKNNNGVCEKFSDCNSLKYNKTFKAKFTLNKEEHKTKIHLDSNLILDHKISSSNTIKSANFCESNKLRNTEKCDKETNSDSSTERDVLKTQENISLTVNDRLENNISDINSEVFQYDEKLNSMPSDSELLDPESKSNCSDSIALKVRNKNIKIWAPIIRKNCDSICNDKNTLVIKDLDAHVLFWMLMYIYSGKVDLSNQFLFKFTCFRVYIHAVRYGLKELADLLAPLTMRIKGRLRTEKSSISWKLEKKDLQFYAHQISLRVKTFNVGRVTWYMHLQFVGKNEFIIQIFRNISFRSNVQYNFVFHVNENDRVSTMKTNTRLLDVQNRRSLPDIRFNLEEFGILLENIESLSIHFNIILDLGYSTDDIAIVSPISASGATLKKLSNDLKFLYESRKFCDICLRVDTKRFYAHRFILSARSPTFSYILKNTAKNTIDLENIDCNTLECLLLFIYTGDVDKKRINISLYEGAKHYSLVDLEEVCRSYIIDHLFEQDICRVFIRAHKNKDLELESIALDYVCQNACEVLLSPRGMDLMRNETDVARKVLQSLATAYKNQK